MAGQHTENLFRRYKGEVVTIKTLSGGVYQGRIAEVTNDFVCISDSATDETKTYILYSSIESLVVAETT